MGHGRAPTETIRQGTEDINGRAFESAGDPVWIVEYGEQQEELDLLVVAGQGPSSSEEVGFVNYSYIGGIYITSAHPVP